MRAALTSSEYPVLIKVSTGEISLMEGAWILGLPDAGFLMQQLSEAGLSLPQLSAMVAEKQARAASSALADCSVLRRKGSDVAKKDNG